MSGTEIFRSGGDLMFGQVREDALVDMFLVSSLPAPQRLFVIASGGCTALSLLASGNFQIDALDISQSQIALVEAKLAMFKHFGAEAATRACCGDATEAVRAVTKFLPPQSQEILSSLVLNAGFNNCGVVDRRMKLLTNLFNLFIHGKARTRQFLTMTDPGQQLDFFEKHWTNLQWRLAMKIVFARGFLYLTHDRSAASLVPDDFSAVMERRLVRALTEFPNATNPYLWQAFLGQYNLSQDCLPPYLQAANHPKIIANIDNLHLICADTLEWFSRQPGESFDYFGLSNVLELLPPDYAARLKLEVIRCARPNALICVRNIFPRTKPIFDSGNDPLESHDVSQGESKLGTELGGRLVLDKDLSDQAAKMDRSLFCNFFEIYRCT